MRSRDEVLTPYVGLQPFSEKHEPFFFGREREVRVIGANLLVPALTVLYGPSGVGKSSILQAGVMPHLRQQPDTAVLYFNRWQDDSFLDAVKGELRAIVPRPREEPRTDAEPPLDAVARRARSPLYLLLDQFEEYLMYHEGTPAAEQFEAAVARLINDESSTVKVLIGIREDGLSKFDRRLSIRVPDLLGNTIPVAPLSADAARDAIRKPLEVWNQTRVREGEKYRIEEELVEAVIAGVVSGRTAISEASGRGSRGGADSAVTVEAPYLQLVLTRLWEAEEKQRSRSLRTQTLQEMGGAGQIVQSHVDEVMKRLESDEDREIVALISHYLVTPTGAKIAQSPADLVQYAEGRPERAVRKVLRELTDRQDTRILRRLAMPERYELYHDVLAPAVVDWCRRYREEKKRKEEQARQAAEAARRQRELEQAQALNREQQEKLELQKKLDEALRRRNADMVFAPLAAVGGQGADLEKVRETVVEAAQRSISWYLQRKNFFRVTSQVLQTVAIAGAGSAAVLPALGAFFTQFAHPMLFYLVLIVAGLALSIDRLMGYQANWVRFTLTASELQRALADFQMDWITETQRGAAPAALLERARDFRRSIEDIVRAETEGWASARSSSARRSA